MNPKLLRTATILLAILIPNALSIVHAQGMLVPEPDARAGASQAGIAASDDDQWNYEIGPFNADGPVYEAVVAPNGDLYIGGDFTTVGGVAANRIARWNGTAWSALGTGIPAGRVYAIAFRGNEVIVGGNFRGAGDQKTTNIARWTGTAWAAFGDITNEGLDSTVMDIAVRGSRIFVAGNFTYTGNQDAMNYIAYWDDAEKLFISLDDGTRRGTDGGISSMAVVGDALYVAGAFTRAGGTNASRIARWNDTSWSNLITGVGAQGGPSYIASIAAQDTSIVVVGNFTFAGGKPMKYIAKWSTQSSAWYTVGNGGFDSAANKVIITAAGDVFATGNFSKAGGGAAAHIAKWSAADGWKPLGSGLDAPGFALAAIGKTVWAGGGFATAGGKASANLARWTDEPVSTTDAGPAERVVTALTAHVSPNPVRDLANVSIALPHPGAPSISISDIRGATVRSFTPGRLPGGPNAVPVDVSGMAPGVYYLRVSMDDMVTITELIVAR